MAQISFAQAQALLLPNAKMLKFIFYACKRNW